MGRGCPLPTRAGVWAGAVPPLQKIFRFFSLKRRDLVHSGTDKTYTFDRPGFSMFGQQPSRGGAIAPIDPRGPGPGDQ